MKLNFIPHTYITLYFNQGIIDIKTDKSVVLVSLIIKIIPNRKKISLILLTKTAFNADLLAEILVYQKFISR